MKCLLILLDFPGASDGNTSVYNVGDLGQSLDREDLLEKEMVTHSSVLAWKIPWMGLQSMGSQTVGHDLVTSLSLLILLCVNGATQGISDHSNRVKTLE